jgi:hypothetical protein
MLYWRQSFTFSIGKVKTLLLLYAEMPVLQSVTKAQNSALAHSKSVSCQQMNYHPMLPMEHEKL